MDMHVESQAPMGRHGARWALLTWLTAVIGIGSRKPPSVLCQIARDSLDNDAGSAMSILHSGHLSPDDFSMSYPGSSQELPLSRGCRIALQQGEYA